MTTEKDVRVQMVNSIFGTPHGDLKKLVPLHRENLETNPLFYAKMSLYYHKNGSVRDHKKLFATALVTGPVVELRELGQLLLVQLSPKDLLKSIDTAFNDFNGGVAGKGRRIRSAVEGYLRSLEKEAATDGSYRFVKNARFIRELYRRLHISPHPHAAASLGFRTSVGRPYVGFQDMKDLAAATDEREICEIISQGNIPALNAFGAVKRVTPAIAAALAERMSGKELQNFTKMMQKRGLLLDKEFKARVSKKLSQKSQDLSMRGASAAKVLGRDADMMIKATDDYVKTLAEIDRVVLLCIDKSGSMSEAIEVGKEVATLLASKVKEPKDNLLIAAFDATSVGIPLPVEATHSQFELTFKYMKADGYTSLGSAVKFALDRGFEPDVILFVTDGDENQPPFLRNVIKDSGLYGVRLVSCLVGKRVRQVSLPREVMEDKAIEVENLDFSGDYYALPNLLQAVAKGGIRELIQEIDNIDITAGVEELRKAV